MHRVRNGRVLTITAEQIADAENAVAQRRGGTSGVEKNEHRNALLFCQQRQHYNADQERTVVSESQRAEDFRSGRARQTRGGQHEERIDGQFTAVELLTHCEKSEHQRANQKNNVAGQRFRIGMEKVGHGDSPRKYT